jgi:hypothetical protein
MQGREEEQSNGVNGCIQSIEEGLRPKLLRQHPTHHHDNGMGVTMAANPWISP